MSCPTCGKFVTQRVAGREGFETEHVLGLAAFNCITLCSNMSKGAAELQGWAFNSAVRQKFTEPTFCTASLEVGRKPNISQRGFQCLIKHRISTSSHPAFARASTCTLSKKGRASIQLRTSASAWPAF